MINIVSKRYWYFALSLLIIVPGLICATMKPIMQGTERLAARGALQRSAG